MQKPTIKKVRANDLSMDITVQRDLDTRRVRKMAADLRLEAIGTLCVSRRSDGTMVVIDGGHRRGALIEAGEGDTPVNAEVYTGLELADEAALFRYRNATQKVPYLDRFRVRLIEGEKQAVAVEALAKKHGWAVIPSSNDNTPVLLSVMKLEQLTGMDEDVADLTLEVVTRAWGYTYEAVDYRVLDGLFRFLKRYWKDVDVDDLVIKLSNYSGGPEALVSRAQGLRDTLATSQGMAVAELITEAYNKGKKHGGKRLPSWRA